jgi:hypothetical protein
VPFSTLFLKFFDFISLAINHFLRKHWFFAIFSGMGFSVLRET